MTTYYVLPDGHYKCWECGRTDKKGPFVKLGDLYGARHKSCIEGIESMIETPPPEEIKL